MWWLWYIRPSPDSATWTYRVLYTQGSLLISIYRGRCLISTSMFDISISVPIFEFDLRCIDFDVRYFDFGPDISMSGMLRIIDFDLRYIDSGTQYVDFIVDSSISVSIYRFRFRSTESILVLLSRFRWSIYRFWCRYIGFGSEISSISISTYRLTESAQPDISPNTFDVIWYSFTTRTFITRYIGQPEPVKSDRRPHVQGIYRFGSDILYRFQFCYLDFDVRYIYFGVDISVSVTKYLRYRYRLIAWPNQLNPIYRPTRLM